MPLVSLYSYSYITTAFSNMEVRSDVLDVQLKQSKYMTSAKNVNKLGNFVLKCVETEHLQTKLTMNVYLSEYMKCLQVHRCRFILIQHPGSRNDILTSTCSSKLGTRNYLHLF